MTAPRDDLIRMAGRVEIRADGEKGRTLVGYAAKFNEDTVIDSWEGRFVERLAPGAFTDTLREDGAQVKVLFNHGMDPQIGDKPLGRISVIREDKVGLWIEVPLSRTSYNDDLIALLGDEALDGMSFRFSVVEETWTDGDPMPTRTLNKVRLFELGPVTFPAYQATTAGVRTRESFDRWRAGDRPTPDVPGDTTAAGAEGADTPAADAAGRSTAHEPTPAAGAMSARIRYAAWWTSHHGATPHRTETTPMNRMEEIRARLAELQPEINRLGQADSLGEDEARSLTEKISEFDTLEAELKPLEERAAAVARITATEIRRETGDGARAFAAPNVSIRQDPFEVLETRGAGLSPAKHKVALADALLRANENLIEGREAQAGFEKIVKRHAGHTSWAENMLHRSRPEYTSGFKKMLVGQAHLLDAEERTALGTLTAANGSSLVPTHLDPTIILTNVGGTDVLRTISRVETLTTGNVWHGISSAGVTASWDTELSEVSDDTPTIAAPSVTLYAAQAFVQASFQIIEDVDGLANEILVLFADARERLEGAAHFTGTGPLGVSYDVTTAGSLVVSTTAATIGEVDLASVYQTVGERWRGRATWVMHPKWALAVKRLGTAVSANFSGDLREAPTTEIYNRPVVVSDFAPSDVTTTVKDNEIIFGDFSNFLIVDKPGSTSIEFVPHLFNTSNNLPDGRRGWYMHWRNGSASLNDAAFAILQDKTSA